MNVIKNATIHLCKCHGTPGSSECCAKCKKDTEIRQQIRESLRNRVSQTGNLRHENMKKKSKKDYNEVLTNYCFRCKSAIGATSLTHYWLKRFMDFHNTHKDHKSLGEKE